MSPRPLLPPTSGLPPLRLWPLVLQYGARALVELCLARIEFAHLEVVTIPARNAAMRAQHGEAEPTASHLATLAWIAYTIPRVARRLPFRSDCLVQALAAQRWLANRGMAGEIVIGAERPGEVFGAHAWVVCCGQTVTGGDTTRYTVLI